MSNATQVNLFTGECESDRRAHIRTSPPSQKQAAILARLSQHGEITLSKAVELVGGDIHTNERFHVGNILSRMVKRGMIERVKPGVFRVAGKEE